MNKPTMSKQDRKRWRAMVAFQIVAYGYLLVMFLIQMHMLSNRGW